MKSDRLGGSTGLSGPVFLASALFAGMVVQLAAPAQGLAQDAEAGKVVYDLWCAECHGVNGAGDGPAAASMLPRPRDFTQARYQIRRTGSGQLPTDDDIRAAIRDGLPGTTMPGWPNLSARETEDVIAYLKSFSRFFGMGDPPQPMELGTDPGGGPAAIESGAAAYLALECEACHGPSGRGDGASAPTLEDWRGFPIRAADLSEVWLFNGGSSVDDIHTRVLTGLDGTPMPAASDAMNAGVVTPEEVWALAHYVASLGPSQAPPLNEVVRVGRAEAGLPGDGDADSWGQAEAFYFPLGGQVIEPPRNFAPTVDGVWVQGLHDGNDVALRIQWNDPSRSPDPSWDEWQLKVSETLDMDGAFDLDASLAAVDAEITENEPRGDAEVEVPRYPDRFYVQFPFEIPTGSQRPYFLMGDARNPVYLWTWDSEQGVGAARGRGLASAEELPEDAVAGQATWSEGRWTLYVRRALVPDPEADGITFAEGAAIPVAFQAWDGSSGETERRSSISTWYYILLEPPASNRVVVAPMIAMLLTGAFGLVLVRRAQGGD